MKFTVYESVYDKLGEGTTRLVSAQDSGEIDTKLGRPEEIVKELERQLPRVLDYRFREPVTPEQMEPFRIFSCEYETKKRVIVYHFIQKLPRISL